MQVPYEELDKDTLRNLIEHFVAREGTDYGEREYTLDEKIAQVMRQLREGQAEIVFDADTESCNIVTRQ